jgi:hypothetical protein
VPADGTRAAALEKRRLRYVAAFVGQLSDKPLLASTFLCGGSERIAQWQRHYVLIRLDDGVDQWGKSRMIAQIRTEGSESGHYPGGHHQTNRAMPEPITIRETSVQRA